jgi:hypothetical protein
VPSVNMIQMMPKLNGTQALSNPIGTGASALNFAKMLPSFSSLRTGLWPISTPTSQVPASAFGQPKLKNK